MSSVVQTKMGTPVPFAFGRNMIKSPLVTYYAGFRADRYTETYAVHAKFNAWPLVLMSIMESISKPATGELPEPHQHTNGNNRSNTGDPIQKPVKTKERQGGQTLLGVILWLLDLSVLLCIL